MLFLPTEIEKPVKALVSDEHPVSYAQGLLPKQQVADKRRCYMQLLGLVQQMC
jgi:hypothetical protein